MKVFLTPPYRVAPSFWCYFIEKKECSMFMLLTSFDIPRPLVLPYCSCSLEKINPIWSITNDKWYVIISFSLCKPHPIHMALSCWCHFFIKKQIQIVINDKLYCIMPKYLCNPLTHTVTWRYPTYFLYIYHFKNYETLY